MTRGAYEIAGSDRAAADVRSLMSGTHAYWPPVPYPAGTRLPVDPELRLRWLTGYADGMTRTLAQYTTGPEEPEPDLREHLRLLHPQMAVAGKSDLQLADAHAQRHYRMGSPTHHHGPNAGPHARPRGWRDGSGVVMTDPGQRDLRRPS